MNLSIIVVSINSLMNNVSKHQWCKRSPVSESNPPSQKILLLSIVLSHNMSIMNISETALMLSLSTLVKLWLQMTKELTGILTLQKQWQLKLDGFSIQKKGLISWNNLIAQRILTCLRLKQLKSLHSIFTTNTRKSSSEIDFHSISQHWPFS